MEEGNYNKEIKILIVDDDRSVSEFLQRFLRTKGFKEVLAVDTGEKALEIARKEEIKLVLLDIRLPDINGVDVLRKLKELKKDIGVIMITGFPEEAIAKQAMEEGAYDYIMKPFDLAYLELSVFTKVALMP